MKEIECPGCGERIPDDSKYCDMCGVMLLECINCGTIGTDDFCPECGKPMVSRKSVNFSVSDKDETSKTKNDKKTEPKVDGNTTIGGQRPTLCLKSRDGKIILRPENDAIIGRREGPYVSDLSDMNLISRRHGKFVRRGRDWYIEDFGSTNGTYVNDHEVPFGTPVKISPGDVVDIGTYIFDVLER